MMSVGASPSRTPIKHRLYNTLLGKVVGSASRFSFIQELVIIDACAGDGISTAFSGTCSPQITCKQLPWAEQRGLLARGILIEQNPHSFAQLRENVATMTGGQLAQLVNDDYRSDHVAQQIRWPQAVFLHIDPNHVGDVELSQAMRAALPQLTTMLVTMGCNAGGLHRLPYDERKEWYDRLRYLLSIKQPWHDACLIQLRKDAAQWAYLLTVPTKWRDDTKDAIASVNRNGVWLKGIQDDWLSVDNGRDFWLAADNLFLRKGGSEVRPA